MTHIAALSFLWHPLGYCPRGPSYEACRSYGFWSGIAGSFLVSLPGWVVALLIWTHHANCHARWCPRLGRHPVEGTPYKTCRKHHPAIDCDDPTAEDICDAYDAACDARDGPDSVRAAREHPRHPTEEAS